jgi:uncharacterized protein YdhG (YjbR/CyaY superfamily)
MKPAQPTDIDSYIAAFPSEVQMVLQQIRNTIKAAAPDATEAIKYAMPTFIDHGNLVHFAAYTNHIGFYATPTAHMEFADALASYKVGKGSVQFPLNKPLPLDLITRMVKFRVRQNLEWAKAKSK